MGTDGGMTVAGRAPGIEDVADPGEHALKVRPMGKAQRVSTSGGRGGSQPFPRPPAPNLKLMHCPRSGQLAPAAGEVIAWRRFQGRWGAPRWPDCGNGGPRMAPPYP